MGSLESNTATTYTEDGDDKEQQTLTRQLNGHEAEKDELGLQTIQIRREKETLRRKIEALTKEHETVLQGKRDLPRP